MREPEPPPAPPAPVIDPGVELLPDVPIPGVEADLFARLPVATRLVELAMAQPSAVPRVIALAGAPGAGKTSTLRIATGLLAERADCAFIMLDGAGYPTAERLLADLVAELGRFFTAAGVVDTTDTIRDKLAGYGDLVSSIARFANIKIDVAGAVKRSPDAIRAEIAEMVQEVGKRLVIVLDHLDRLPGAELGALLAALRFYEAIPYVTLLLAVDRRGAATRVDTIALERLVDVELALPPADTVLLARVIAGGLSRLAARLGRDLDDALPLFDPEGGPALALIETPRDAKRAVNALSAVIPMWPADVDLADACLEVVLRLLVPELDGPRLNARHRLRGDDRRALLAELVASIAGHRRAPAARAALAVLLAD